MRTPAISPPALLRATLLGTVLQTTMVVAGHFLPAVAQLFGLMGVSLSLLAGLAYALWATGGLDPRAGQAGAAGGALAGGTCALIGIAISVALGDVPAAVLGFGTASSAVAGALGATLAAVLQRRRAELKR